MTDAARLKAILPGVPIVESPFFKEMVTGCGFDPETERVAKELDEKGFAVMRFPDEAFDARAEPSVTRWSQVTHYFL